MKDIPCKDEKTENPKKKAILIITSIFIIGIIAGIILSNEFVNLTNDRLDELTERFPEAQPLTGSDVIFPTFGVIILCISVFLLIGLIGVYITVFRKTKSKYILALLLFLGPLLIKSLFAITAMRTLFMSTVITFKPVRDTLGFTGLGFGAILIIAAFFEIIAMSILMYLSME